MANTLTIVANITAGNHYKVITHPVDERFAIALECKTCGKKYSPNSLQATLNHTVKHKTAH